MNLQDLAKQERILTVNIADEQLQIVYHPHVITTRFRSQHKTIAGFLAGCVVSWDLQDGDETIPLEEQVILECVPDILNRLIYTAIGEDLYPKAWRAPRSGDSS